MDFGADSLATTRSLLAANGLEAFGAGKDLAEARRPVIVTRKGIRFGFLGYGVAHSRRVYASKQRPGIAPIVMEDIRKDIAALRSKVDVLILSLHWGMEYDSLPSARQREQAHQLLDWGADMILGHHPHVVQGIEVYKNKVIAYSLGNFVFDQRGKGTNRSFILAASFGKQGFLSGRIIPLDRKKRYSSRRGRGTVRDEHPGRSNADIASPELGEEKDASLWGCSAPCREDAPLAEFTHVHLEAASHQAPSARCTSAVSLTQTWICLWSVDRAV